MQIEAKLSPKPFAGFVSQSCPIEATVERSNGNTITAKAAEEWPQSGHSIRRRSSLLRSAALINPPQHNAAKRLTASAAAAPQRRAASTAHFQPTPPLPGGETICGHICAQEGVSSHENHSLMRSGTYRRASDRDRAVAGGTFARTLLSTRVGTLFELFRLGGFPITCSASGSPARR